MIKSFQHTGLKRYWNRGQKQQIHANMRDAVAEILGVLEDATTLDDMDQPGWRFHSLKGFRPTRYSVLVQGGWCITFEWDEKEGDAEHVDFENYHAGHH